MISPFLSGLPSLNKTPVTWILVFFYIMFFISFRVEQVKEGQLRNTLLEDDFFIKAQGRVYTQHLIRHETQYDDFLLDLASLALAGDLEKTLLLGNLAFQDWSFLKSDKDLFSGDQVEIAYWHQKLDTYLKQTTQTPSFYLGASIKNQEWYYFLSYQFVHGHIWHLLFNCWFLLIFGGFLEPLIGHFLFSSLYLFGGCVGALTYTKMSQLSFFPLIGASASINTLIGFFTLFYFQQSIRFFFFLLPIRGWWGWIFLPTWLVVGIWFIVDLSGYLSTLQGFGHIAYAAHLGGFVFGVFCGLAYQKANKTTKLSQDLPQKIQFQHA